MPCVLQCRCWVLPVRAFYGNFGVLIRALAYIIHVNRSGTPFYERHILHSLGIDHTKLTFRFQGRDYRLTDVHGEVIRPILV